MPEISNSLVVVLGVGIVFIGLISIIILCKIMSAVCMLTEKKNNSEKTVDAVSATVAAANSVQPIENRQELIAAVSAALAEELGTDVSALRILSFKKI